MALMLETARTFFRLREAGKRTGGVTAWGGGLWGFLNSLALGGPQTVPQIARARPVARQRIQRLADEAAAAGLVEFIANPAHKRSRLVRLTGEGETFHAQLTERLRDLAEGIAGDMETDELRVAHEVLARLRGKLERCEPPLHPRQTGQHVM